MEFRARSRWSFERAPYLGLKLCSIKIGESIRHGSFGELNGGIELNSDIPAWLSRWDEGLQFFRIIVAHCLHLWANNMLSLYSMFVHFKVSSISAHKTILKVWWWSFTKTTIGNTICVSDFSLFSDVGVQKLVNFWSIRFGISFFQGGSGNKFVFPSSFTFILAICLQSFFSHHRLLCETKTHVPWENIFVLTPLCLKYELNSGITNRYSDG